MVTLIVCGSTASAVGFMTLRVGMMGEVFGCLTMIAGVDGRSG